MPGPRTPHFALLTVFFPMWNEEEYIERALGSPDRRTLAGLSALLESVGEAMSHSLLPLQGPLSRPLERQRDMA